MAKKAVEVNAVGSPLPRQRRRGPAVAGIVLGLAISPLAFEATKICYGHWMTALGEAVDVRTPLLDWISDNFRQVHADAWNRASSYLNHANWDPKIVVIIAILIMSLASSLLKS